MKAAKTHSASLSAEELDFLRGLFAEPDAVATASGAADAARAPEALPGWLRGAPARLCVDHGDHRLEFDVPLDGAQAGPWRLERPRVIDCRGPERGARAVCPAGIRLIDTLGRFHGEALQDVSADGAALWVKLTCPMMRVLRTGQYLGGLRLELHGAGQWLVRAELARVEKAPGVPPGELETSLLLGLRFRTLPVEADRALRTRLLAAYGRRLEAHGARSPPP
ncbi:hypothetical protein [Alkalilimnicola sp. S0819]|uniref:hypothetical protein n=1 Tax=Alkalilimnicola sp. S0819 TaxID=2613922 RepID=UPI0012617EDC|nr:hypothetical protein [Alkalilimnicola sp. S0819]KAB7623707.1 hypothetical protein F3N43_09325 [Alkalilimnicola sp. S0819]MPQ16836.1 hypothetical protein [Alkalilimnicola sp. S0819]